LAADATRTVSVLHGEPSKSALRHNTIGPSDPAPEAVEDVELGLLPNTVGNRVQLQLGCELGDLSGQ
jgi:hypothetical protein